MKLAADIARLSPEDAAAVPRFIADNRAKFDAFRPVLQRSFASWRDLVTPDLLRALPALRPWRSVDGDLGRVVVAAAEGTEAGMAIHKALMKEALR